MLGVQNRIKVIATIACKASVLNSRHARNVTDGPRTYSIDRINARGKPLSDLCGCPVIAIIWRVRVSDVIDLFVNGMNVMLRKSERKRENSGGMVFE
jgi:hypothetical protein